MLTSWLQKLATTKGRLWKWLLGLAVFFGALYLAWWVKQRRDERDVLERDAAFALQRAEDAKARAAVEKNKDYAALLHTQAGIYLQQVRVNLEKASALKLKIAIAQKDLNAVKDWKELTARAKGEPK
jgi:hypothetical protein